MDCEETEFSGCAPRVSRCTQNSYETVHDPLRGLLRLPHDFERDTGLIVEQSRLSVTRTNEMDLTAEDLKLAQNIGTRAIQSDNVRSVTADLM